jgi:hypothetical protein
MRPMPNYSKLLSEMDLNVEYMAIFGMHPRLCCTLIAL